LEVKANKGVYPYHLAEDFSEVWSECRIRSSILAEFGGKVNAKKIQNTLLPLPGSEAICLDHDHSALRPLPSGRQAMGIGTTDGCLRSF
jgi:hypothetical protein